MRCFYFEPHSSGWAWDLPVHRQPFVKFEQTAPAVWMMKNKVLAVWVVGCGPGSTVPQKSKRSSAVFSKEVHMEGDSLCLPAAVALLRVWLNRSVAICSGPGYREQDCTVPISVMSVWIWLYMLFMLTTNTLLSSHGHKWGNGECALRRFWAIWLLSSKLEEN